MLFVCIHGLNKDEKCRCIHITINLLVKQRNIGKRMRKHLICSKDFLEAVYICTYHGQDVTLEDKEHFRRWDT